MLRVHTFSYSHYLVSDRSPTGGSTVHPVAQAVRRAQRSDLARSGLAPPLFIPNGPNYHPTPNPSTPLLSEALSFMSLGVRTCEHRVGPRGPLAAEHIFLLDAFVIVCIVTSWFEQHSL